PMTLASNFSIGPVVLSRWRAKGFCGKTTPLSKQEAEETMTASREVRLKSRPVGLPISENFELATVDVPAPGLGEVQVRNTWMSVDPYMRGRMMEAKSYAAPYEVGKAMWGGAVGEVVAS